MNIQSAIDKEVFIPRDERLLVAVEVQRRKRKRMSFLPTATKDYATFICVSVTNTKPHQLLITKVKKFGGSSTFTRRSQWIVEQLRQVNGVNSNKDSPEFDLVFDNGADQWVTTSSAEKCIFVQILYHACQAYWKGKAGSLGKTGILGKLSKLGNKRRVSGEARNGVGPGPGASSAVSPRRTLQARRKSHIPPKQADFINCQSKLTGDARAINLFIYRCEAFLNRMKNLMVTNQSRSPGPGNVVHRLNAALGERGNRLTRAEDKTAELLHKAQYFADTAHKLSWNSKK